MLRRRVLTCLSLPPLWRLCSDLRITGRRCRRASRRRTALRKQSGPRRVACAPCPFCRDFCADRTWPRARARRRAAQSVGWGSGLADLPSNPVGLRARRVAQMVAFARRDPRRPSGPVSRGPGLRLTFVRQAPITRHRHRPRIRPGVLFCRFAAASLPDARLAGTNISTGTQGGLYHRPPTGGFNHRRACPPLANGRQKAWHSSRISRRRRASVGWC